MNTRPRIPLLAKLLGWLLLHLLLLAAAFALFVAWQLRLGLDSLLSGSTGERLRALGEVMARDLQDAPESEWRSLLQAEAARRGVGFDLWLPRSGFRFGLLPPPPENIRRRLDQALPPVNPPPRPRPAQGPDFRPELRSADRPLQGPPPQHLEPGVSPPGPPRQGPGFRPENGPPGPFADAPPPADPGAPRLAPARGEPRAPQARTPPDRPPVRAVFFARGNHGDGYWATLHLPLTSATGTQGPRHVALVIRSDQLAGGGLFFDLRPWLYGGLAVLVLSLVFWAPFFASISRYLGHLTKATGRIASGRFDVALDTRRRDELGELGHAIQTMAARLDAHLAGQKRFLGDVAHELCSPLARLRTGLGILEQQLSNSHDAGQSDNHRPRLAAIETEAAELAALIEEILAFSRAASGRPAQTTAVLLAPLLARAAARECPELALDLAVPPDLAVLADPHLLERAVANVFRNSRRYAGPAANLRATAETRPDARVALCLDDDGPGVANADPERLFEPFYRPDAARSRDHGGSGLGLAIVRSCTEACGGSAKAANLAPKGFRVELLLHHQATLP